ncbi:30S ribosomal protein S7 [Chitinispirillales bacterium ANBcel5]|uniref:30S ribosomal protein S7 n=1 Tax=Cellulosispirillum alkaliphilum TaxID=3039283 RepID=UPI002A5186AC|nr:30S ribosomal protein S7 [Chitinispirillales bacterium ANBcel5]
MSRRRKAEKREVLADPKYKSVLVTQFVNNVTRQGKKRLAEGLFYDAIEIVNQRTGQDGITVFKKAVDNVKPVLEVKSRRVGGANYQVPIEVKSERRVSLAIRWLINYARSRSEKSMAEKLANEFIQASKNEGGAVRKKVDTHKMAEANKAFAHFRF